MQKIQGKPLKCFKKKLVIYNFMNTFSENSKAITDEIQRIIKAVSLDDTDKIIFEIVRARSVFIFGAGRSGLVGKAFAMRLVHLGKIVHFVGDTTTPAIKSRDLLIVITGSGKTSSVKNVAESAKSQGAKILSITTQTGSPIGQLSDVIVNMQIKQIETRGNNYLARQLEEKNTEEITPMGTLFELSAMIYFDSIIPVLMERLGVREGDMKERHANLE